MEKKPQNTPNTPKSATRSTACGEKPQNTQNTRKKTACGVKPRNTRNTRKRTAKSTASVVQQVRRSSHPIRRAAGCAVTLHLFHPSLVSTRKASAGCRACRAHSCLRGVGAKPAPTSPLIHSEHREHNPQRSVIPSGVSHVIHSTHQRA